MQRCDDEDDAQALNDPSGDDDRCLSASSPSRSLSEVSFGVCECWISDPSARGGNF
jgi:hypothetical protein